MPQLWHWSCPSAPWPCSAIPWFVPQLHRPISGQAVPSRGCICQGEQPPAASTGLRWANDGATQDFCSTPGPPPNPLSTPQGPAKPSASQCSWHCHHQAANNTSLQPLLAPGHPNRCRNVTPDPSLLSPV